MLLGPTLREAGCDLDPLFVSNTGIQMPAEGSWMDGASPETDRAQPTYILTQDAGVGVGARIRMHLSNGNRTIRCACCGIGGQEVSATLMC